MKNITKLFALALVAVLITALAPTAALAVDLDYPIDELIIGHSGCLHDLSEINLQEDDESCHTFIRTSYYRSVEFITSGDGWSYDVDSCTLTLDGYNGSGIWCKGNSGQDNTLTIKLIGENTVTGLQNGSEPNMNYRAISTDSCHIDIHGPGTLNVNAHNGIYPGHRGGACNLHISNGAKVNTTTFLSGLQGKEIIIDSGCVVIANSTNPAELVGVSGTPGAVSAQHIRCNGTLIATNAYPGESAISSGPATTIGSNITFTVGTSAADAKPVEIITDAYPRGFKSHTAQYWTTSPSQYGEDTGDFYCDDDLPYMAMIEAGYSGGTTVTPPVTPPVAPSLVAKPTASTVLVNGTNVAFDAYNIDGNNYFKLRDLAYTLSGSSKQFDVGWDGANNAIALTSGNAYTVTGGEMTGKGTGDKTPAATTSKIYLDGAEIQLTAYNIEGNNYFKLRDIGIAFDFDVTWDGARNTIVIDTNKSYTPD
jgi:hypothetical protein